MALKPQAPWAWKTADLRAEEHGAQPLLFRGAGNCATSPHRTRTRHTTRTPELSAAPGVKGAQPLERSPT